MERTKSCVENSFKNKFMTLFYAISTNFTTKKKVDEINEENLEKARKRKTEITILLHGVAANYYRSMHSTIELLKKYGVDVVSVGYDYHQSVEDSSEDIKKQIDSLMRKTGVKKINIIGICLGGLVARYYAEMLGGKKNIDRLVTIYSPLRAIPSNEFGVKLNKIIGGNPEIYNRALKEIENRHSVKNHLYIYSEDDKIIRPEYSTDEKTNQICLGGGHLLVSYNPLVLKIASDFIKGKKILEDKLQ